MFKKILLSTLLFTSSFTVQAEDGWWSFWGALIGSLIGSSSNQPSKPVTIIHVPVPAPSAPPASVYSNNYQALSNNRVMCASGLHCNSVIEVKFSCGHGMCKSCLRSRKEKEIKKAQGGEPYVTCPICGDMLTWDILRQV